MKLTLLSYLSGFLILSAQVGIVKADEQSKGFAFKHLKLNTMKNFTLLLFIFSSILVSAQVGINTETPRGILEVNSGTSKNQGFVMPQVTKVEDVVNTQDQEDAVAVGTMVYDLSRDAVCIKHTSGWNCTSVDGTNQTVNDPLNYNNSPTYIKASNTGAGDYFGYSVAISADGNTLAVGAYWEDSNATGINGDQNDNSASNSGAVYVFVRNGTTWAQEAYIKASNTNANDFFGVSVAISADGNTLAVGAGEESSNATGVNGNQSNNSASYSGAVYVFVRNGTTWAQEAYIKASNTGASDYFGRAVALSADGNALAVGAYGESSNATGVNGNQSNNSASYSGAVYVFVRSGTTWAQEAYIKASNTGASDAFGGSVALSADGNTLAVGARLEDSNATGINGDQTNNSASNSGAVYVFVRNGTTWAQEAYIKASNTNANDYFGYSVSLSSDGNALAIGAYWESSNATGINGNQTNNSASNSGAVYVFVRNGTTWAQEAYIKASNTNANDYFGYSVSLSSDGNALAIGAYGESSNATGVNGNQSNNSANSSGAVYVFQKQGGVWVQQAYVKASNTNANDYFGSSVSLSSDGNALAIGAFGEASNATGINGDQNDNSANGAGAVYVYE